jgi:hypothetical protein
MWATGQSGGAPDSHCSLSGAPSAPALTSARAVRTLFTVPVALQATVGACNHCSAWHTGQSGATPDSPVNYSGLAPRIPEAEQFRGILPGASDTVQWHTGQSSAPDQGSLRLSSCSFNLNPFLDFLLVCVEPLAPVELII